MAFKFLILAATLAYAHAGLLSTAPATITQYSPASAVSSSYLHQSQVAPSLTYAAQAVPSHVAVGHAPVAIHDPHYGSTHESVIRSYGGNQAVSSYSKAVDSAFSSVRKYDTRITNDAVSITPVAAAHQAPAIAVAHQSPAIATYATHIKPVAYSHTPALATYTHTGPIQATYAHAAPLYPAATPFAAAPVVAKTAVHYSPAVAVAHATFSGLGTSYQW